MEDSVENSEDRIEVASREYTAGLQEALMATRVEAAIFRASVEDGVERRDFDVVSAALAAFSPSYLQHPLFRRPPTHSENPQPRRTQPRTRETRYRSNQTAQRTRNPQPPNHVQQPPPSLVFGSVRGENVDLDGNQPGSSLDPPAGLIPRALVASNAPWASTRRHQANLSSGSAMLPEHTSSLPPWDTNTGHEQEAMSMRPSLRAPAADPEQFTVSQPPVQYWQQLPPLRNTKREANIEVDRLSPPQATLGHEEQPPGQGVKKRRLAGRTEQASSSSSHPLPTSSLPPSLIQRGPEQEDRPPKRHGLRLRPETSSGHKPARGYAVSNPFSHSLLTESDVDDEALDGDAPAPSTHDDANEAEAGKQDDRDPKDSAGTWTLNLLTYEDKHDILSNQSQVQLPPMPDLPSLDSQEVGEAEAVAERKRRADSRRLQDSDWLCSLCPEDCAQAGTRPAHQRHMELHAQGVLTYPCPDCGRLHKNKNAVWRHRMANCLHVSAEFLTAAKKTRSIASLTCDVCPPGTYPAPRSQKAHYQHMRMHEKGSGYQCPDCGRFFHQIYLVEKHRLKVHGKEQEEEDDEGDEGDGEGEDDS